MTRGQQVAQIAGLGCLSLVIAFFLPLACVRRATPPEPEDTVTISNGGTRPRIVRGMNQREVESRMGPPSHTHHSVDLSGHDWITRTYPHDGGTLDVTYGPGGIVWYTDQMTPERESQMVEAIRRSTEEQRRLASPSR